MKTLIHAGLLKLMSLTIFLFIQPNYSVYCQEEGSCAEKLQSAQSLFEKGQVEQVPGLLSQCLESGFNREESLAAYKLLIQSYLFEEKLELADSTMLAFLKKNPEYQISPTDHSSFVSLYHNFVCKVIIQASLHIGSNLPLLSVASDKQLMGIPGEEKYSMKLINFAASIEVKYKLNEKVELNAELGYAQFSIHNREDQGFGTSDYTEFQKRIEFPLSATYDIKKYGRFTPYARIGFGIALTLSSVAKASFEPSDLNNPYEHSGKDINMNPSRILMDLFVQGGAGIKYKTRGGFIFGELRTNFGIFNQLVSHRYDTPNDDLAFYYYIGDDSFRVNLVNFNLGYTFIFYKPVKREEK